MYSSRKFVAKAPEPLPEPCDQDVEEATSHLEAAKESVKNAKKRVHELSLFAGFTPEERVGELKNANKVVRAAEVQIDAADWGCTYYCALRDFKKSMKRSERPALVHLKEILSSFENVPHESEVWTTTHNLVASIETVTEAIDELYKVEGKEKVTNCRRALSLAIKAALKEAAFLKTAVKLVRAAEEREAVYKKEAASLKKELVNWKETVEALQTELKKTRKRARFVFVD